MAADVSVKKEATVNNPCCKVWKEKCGKLEEGRKCLRQAVKLLTEQADKFQAENVSLRKACEEEREKVEAVEEGREKEVALRVALEKEIFALKSEISTLHQKGSAFLVDENTPVKLLQDQVFKGEKEISSLKELLEIEKIRADSEKKNAEVEKKSAADAWKHVKAEKEGKVEEAALRISLENEVSALKSEISASRQKGSMVAEDKSGEVKLLQDQVSKGEKEISRFKELFERQKTRADSEKKNAEVEKKSAAEAWKQMKAEKAKAEEERKHAGSEGKKAEEYQLQLEALKIEAELAKSQLASETLKFEEANKKFEAEKLKVTKEKKHADSEMVKAEVQRKLAEANRNKLMEEKSHTENLCKQLEDARQRIEELQKTEGYHLQLECLKKEAAESKSKLVAETLKLKDLNKTLQAEKTKVTKERKRADSEVAKAKEQRKLAETNGMRVVEERSRADNLSRQLENARIKIKDLEKGINGFALSKNMGGAFDDQPDEITNGEAASIRFRNSLENLKDNSDQSKLVLEYLNYEEATKRLDIEKRKTISEKKHADLEMVKAEKLRKLSEMNSKVAAEEKSRADRLSRQLDEDKIKIEALQKQIQEFQSSKKVVASSVLPNKVMNVEKTKLKLLEKQVKLEKMRLKHAKVVAKMEKNRNSILQQELARLKLDFGEMLFRLDVLDRYFSSSDGGKEKMEKFGDHETMQRSMLKRKLCAEEPCQTYPNNESELLKPSCMAIAVSEPLMQALHCTAPLVSPSSGNYAASISGIDSELESLLGGSNRKLLQTSAINSSSASFSDGQLVGSQERGPLFPSSKKLVEENFRAQTTISGMSDEVTKEVQHNENLAVVAENNVRSPHSIDEIGRVNRHSRKRRILDTVESVELLYSAGKKLHLQMEEKLSTLHGMLNRQMEKPQEEAKYVEPDMQGGSYGKNERTHKKRKIFHEENIIIHSLSGIDQLEKTDKAGKEVLEDANAHGYTSTAALTGVSKACREGLSDSFKSTPEGVISFEEVASGDYMKLLDLDNTADEECYRRAMEMPMSPTLPEIGSSGAGISDNMDNFKPLLDESFLGRLPNGKESLVPSFRSDVIDVEIGSKQLKDCSFGTSCTDVLHENEVHAGSFDILGNRSGTCTAVDSGIASDGQTRGPGSGLEAEMLNIPSSRYEGLKFPIGGKLGSRHDNIPKYCVIFSDINDTISMSRVLFATRTCMARCFLDTQADFMVQKILRALKMEEKILPKEKACTFFTLLLLNFSACNWGKFGNFLDQDFLFCIDSFARDIHAVVSDVEARNLFAEVCCLDELLVLIEEFLLDGKLMVYADLYSEPLSGCDSMMDILLDGVNIKFASKSASADLLVAGSIILASICATNDHIGFLCQASYSLLLVRRCDTGSLLTILHIFAYLTGEKFFSLREHGLTMTVLKSIVVFLEGEDSSGALAASSHTMYKGGMLHPCAKCPFSTDAVSIDIVTSMLLEKLKNCAVSGIMHHLMKSPRLSNSNVLCCKDTSEQSSSNEEVHYTLDVNCDASCSLNKCVMPAQSDSIMNETFCGLSDHLSLVELIACYMTWEWTSSKIISELVKMLERCKRDNFAVAVVILLGQLGRLGVAACGYEDKGVENLRDKLSGFLSQDATIRMALPVQIALATALLGLLSLDFKKLIQNNSHLPSMACQSISVDHLRSWFSSLTEEQQALLLTLLQSSDVR